ncbi:MAG: hypothetical protein FWF24_06395 [Alphaproteobacteria bacterium]|nr:hypothetical protein [Alphaproteobacteria bacterium]
MFRKEFATHAEMCGLTSSSIDFKSDGFRVVRSDPSKTSAVKAFTLFNDGRVSVDTAQKLSNPYKTIPLEQATCADQWEASVYQRCIKQALHCAL